MIAFLDQMMRRWGLDQLKVRTLAIHVCEPDWHWSPLPMTDFDFWLVLAGTGRMTLNGKAHALKPGRGFLLQPGDRVEASQDLRNPLTVLASHFGSAEQPDSRLSRSALPLFTASPEAFRSLGEEAIRLFEDPRSPHLAKLLVMEMVMRAQAPTDLTSDDTALSRLAMDIRLQPGRDWPVPEMARRCFLSIPQFNRKFRQTFGESPRQFVIAQRIRRAQSLLRESRMTLAQIADSLGYQDTYFFHRQFKAATGLTPTQARQNRAEAPRKLR